MWFSHMFWSPWYARYEVMTLLVMLMRCIAMLLVALGYIRLWMAFFLYKMLYDPFLWVECLSCSNWVRMAISCLICAWNPVLLIWDERSIYHHLFLHATLWRSLRFFLPQRHFMYHAELVNYNNGMWDAYAWKICFNVINALNFLFCVLNCCMMFTNEKSHI
jgi:hypothetical protein